MAEPLKAFFSRDLVKRIGADISRVHRSFDAKAFVADASRGLDALELVDRAKHIAAALAAHLPAPYPDAVDVIVRSLGPEHTGEELLGVGMAPFFYMPHTIFVAERGLPHFDVSMRANYELTKRFTAEFSIRPFIAHDPERTMRQLAAWTRDPNPHVRRLVSEGTRLRLPWGSRVAWLESNPERILALLEALKDDPASVVRRSVANNLNDLGKAHSALLYATCRRWLDGASGDRRKLVEHALRSAIKRGAPEALALVGYGEAPKVAIEDVRFAPKRVPIGGRIEISFALRSKARAPQSLLVDLVVMFVKARGRTSPKVFKLQRVELPARGRVDLSASVSLAVHTTRKPYPGQHEVRISINGSAHSIGAFEVIAASKRERAR